MRRSFRAWLVVGACAAVLLVARPAAAQPFDLAAYAIATTNVTVTTTSETVIVSSGPATVRRNGAEVCVSAWVQLTTGAATTTVTPRIRRGTTTAGTLVGEANAVTIGAAAGSTEQFVAMACEDRDGVATVEYSLTVAQASATGNGTALQAGILVFRR